MKARFWDLLREDESVCFLGFAKGTQRLEFHMEKIST